MMIHERTRAKEKLISYLNDYGRLTKDSLHAYLKWLVRTSTNYTKSTIPFAMNLNLKITKKLLNDRLKLALFCNRIWDYSPSYESYGKTIRRHTKPYFGLEMNVKI